MDSYQIVAKIIGPLYLILGVALLFNSEHFLKVMKDIVKCDAFQAGTAFIIMTFGLIIVNAYNSWALDWSLAITLVGWMALILGAAELIFPQKLKKIAAGNMSKGLVHLLVFISLVLGLGLTYVAYFAY